MVELRVVFTLSNFNSVSDLENMMIYEFLQTIVVELQYVGNHLASFLSMGTSEDSHKFQVQHRKGRGTRDQIANIRWIIKKAREFQKNIYALLTYAKAFDCVDHNKLWKQCQTLLFWAPKSLQMVIAAMKLKDAYSLEGKL